MSKINGSIVDEVFYPCWLMVSQLRNGQKIEDGEALYRRACDWIDGARESLSRAGFSESSCDHMLYTQCALLDESVLNRQEPDMAAVQPERRTYPSPQARAGCLVRRAPGVATTGKP
jgi:type VI secretion system protein ImpK